MGRGGWGQAIPFASQDARNLSSRERQFGLRRASLIRTLAGKNIVGRAAVSDQMRELVADKMQHVVKRDYYALLELKPEATPSDVQDACTTLARRLALDRIVEPEVKSMATRVLRTMEEARATLSDPVKRRAWERERSGRTVPVPRFEADPKAERLLEHLLKSTPEQLGDKRVDVARRLHHHGAQLFARGDADGAEVYLRRAVELDDTVADYKLRLGWALFTNRSLPPARRHEEARALIERAIAMNPYSSDARYSMACLWRDMGHLDQCRKELEAALRGKPTHAKAEMELTAFRSADRRAAEAEKRSGLRDGKRGFGLGRLFGRGD